MKLRVIPALILLFTVILPSWAQEVSDDELFEMSLEELMHVTLKIRQTSLIDVPHTHDKGEWMFSYHFMRMNMHDHQLDNGQLSDQEVLQRYMVTPISMDMSMHMLHLMYAPTNRLTLMAMANYTANSMDHITRNGMEFTTGSSGFDDITVGGLYSLLELRHGRVVGSLGVSIPVGTTNAKDITPMSNGNKVRLPYPMQIGTGTVDPSLALTYFSVHDKYGWGADVRNTFRLYENAYRYNTGNFFQTKAWYSIIWSSVFTSTLRLELERRGNYQGQDQALNPMMVYTADPKLRGGTIALGGLGLCYHPKGALKGARLAVEGKLPVYQNLKGPQLATHDTFKVAITHVLSPRK